MLGLRYPCQAPLLARVGVAVVAVVARGLGAVESFAVVVEGPADAQLVVASVGGDLTAGASVERHAAGAAGREAAIHSRVVGLPADAWPRGVLVRRVFHVDAPFVGHAPGPLLAVAGVLAFAGYRYTLPHTATWRTMLPPAEARRCRPPYVAAMDDQASVVNPDSPIYVYVQVAADIQARIKSGQLQAGARLPGERELADQYRIAYGTARRVIQELRDRGLAQTVPSKGTFIVQPPAED